MQAALRALATQIALALDSAALSEEVHRRRSEARFGSLVQHSSDLITVLGPGGHIDYQSPSIERVLGYAPESIVGAPFTDLVEPADRVRILHLVEGAVTGAVDAAQAIECTLVHKDGSLRQFEILMTNLLEDEHVAGIVLNGRDVSERRAFEAQLTHQAFHDAVTGLANRALFAERVRHAIARSRREERGCAVLFLDLDDFKEINDSLGHAAGDEVLIEVARRLDSSVRGADTAARFGGDEFAVLLEEVESAQEAADTAERLLEALSQPLRAGHKEIALRCSLGISVLGRRRHRRRRRDDPRRRRRDVHRQARRQGRATALFEPRDARGRAGAAGAADRPAARDHQRPARAALPAGRAARRRARRGRGGAAALEPPGARHGAARPVHPDRRGDRAHRPDRPLGPARGLPPRHAHARRRCRATRRRWPSTSRSSRSTRATSWPTSRTPSPTPAWTRST